MHTLKIAIVVLLLGIQAAAGQERESGEAAEPVAPANRFVEMQKRISKVTALAQQLGDWSIQAELGRAAVEKVFQRAGWDSEEDLFAFEMFRAMDSRPPWAMQERMDTFFSLLTGRYQLNGDQRTRLKELFYRESVGLFSQHADAILSYSTEMLEARIAGQPFTPEQVARWSKLAEPVMNDGLARMTRATEELMEDMSPEQRAVVQADLRAADRRLNAVGEMMQEWKQGRWEPSDWGMEDDPIQTGKEMAAREGMEPPMTEIPAEPPPAEPSAPETTPAPPLRKTSETPAPPVAKVREAPRPAPEASREAEPSANARQTARQKAAPLGKGESDPWARYVQAFIDKFRLEDAQRQKAWVCYDQTKGRIEQAESKLKAESGPNNQPAKAALEKHASELERTFSQLKLRLERLPTRQQRRDASPEEIPSPIAKPGATTRPGKKK